MLIKLFWIHILLSVIPVIGLAQVSSGDLSSSTQEEDAIYVFGSKDEAFATPGSAHFISNEDIESFSHSDVTRILDKVPGVYIQEEDGLGLRPNIGLRGAHPHRSKKVTLMEDGVLIGPAPYSAPAAYYFPSASRASNIEVFKGPSSVRYGPNSIGGAINLVTRGIERKITQQVKTIIGPISQGMISSTGTNNGIGWRVEAHRLQGEGFKTLRNGEDTDFSKNDLLAKVNYDLSKMFGTSSQKIELKLGFSNEDSKETYLGVTPGDFDSAPFERYAASQDDVVDWKHYMVQTRYQANLAGNTKLFSTAYHHHFERSWNKFNQLSGYTPEELRTFINTGNASIKALLAGDRDSVGVAEDLVIGNNDRSYFSQGVELKGLTSFSLGNLAGEDFYHDLSYGVRFHRDGVDRNHSEINSRMVNGDLIYDQNSFQITNRNEDISRAFTVFIEDEINIGNLGIRIGNRLEQIETERTSVLDSNNNGKNSDTIFVPGAGINYYLTEDAVLIAGVNRGVTIVGPGQDDSVEPEESINYEAGFRLKAPVYLEVIGFYSDYSNIKGTCTFSSGCADSQVDVEFNGGEAEVIGIESLVDYNFAFGKWNFPTSLNFTRTVARFTNNRTSTNTEWGIGEIKSGDPLPYIPQDQVALKLGVVYDKFSSNFNFLWKSEVADQAVETGRVIIPSYGVIDWVGNYRYSKNGDFFLKLDNITDNSYLVSLRPFGARPGKPRTFSVGLNQTF